MNPCKKCTQSNVTLASTDEKKELSKNQRRILSKLYRVGEKRSKTLSHFNFHKECIEEGVTSKTTNFQKRGFFGNKERLGSKEVHLAAKDFFEDKLMKKQKPLVDKLIADLGKTTSSEEFESLNEKWECSVARRHEALKKHREQKIRGLKKGPKKSLRIQRREREEEDQIFEALQRLFEEPVSKKKEKKKKAAAENVAGETLFCILCTEEKVHICEYAEKAASEVRVIVIIMMIVLIMPKVGKHFGIPLSLSLFRLYLRIEKGTLLK